MQCPILCTLMSVGFENPEPESNPLNERLFLIRDLQDIFARHGDILFVRWGELMVASLSGHSVMYYDDEEQGIIEPLHISNRIDRKHGVLASIAIGQPYLPSTYEVPLESVPQGLNSNTAETDDYLRLVLRHAEFRDSPWSIRPGQGDVERAVKPIAIYREYPGLVKFQKFHRFLLAKERNRSKRPPTDS